jgi:uncharacterized protein
MKPQSGVERSNWDTIVVGAGPAGLFTALSLAARGDRQILLLDAGPDVDARRGGTRPAGGVAAFYEAGIGGAGLFSDGKLSYSLDVGGHLETAIPASLRARLVTTIKSVFDELLGDRDVPDDFVALTAVDQHHEAAQAVGLQYRHYPVAQVGTDRCADVIARLRSHLHRLGVSISPRTRMVDVNLEAESDAKLVDVDQDGRQRVLRAETVVLAMGKIGALDQAHLCERLGVARRSQPIYVGARFETSADAVLPLFAASRDPKYSLALPRGDKVKTHCASRNGEVIALNYNGLPLAGGHNYSYAVSKRSGFSILWDGLPINDGFECAQSIMESARKLAGQRLLVQTFSDLQAGRPTRASGLRGIDLTCPSSVPGDLRQVLPHEFFRHAESFLTRLAALAPNLTQDAVMYGPAIEWWMPRLALDPMTMRTTVPGLYACGDGSGWSQGIVHAAATGLLAGQAIAGDPGDLCAALRHPGGSWSAPRRTLSLST